MDSQQRIVRALTTLSGAHGPEASDAMWARVSDAIGYDYGSGADAHRLWQAMALSRTEVVVAIARIYEVDIYDVDAWLVGADAVEEALDLLEDEG